MPNTPDPKTMFVTAEQCFSAAKALVNEMHTTPSTDLLRYLVPAVTLDAFALELYLKTLAVMEGKPLLKNTHNLHELFMILSPETQTEIRERSTPHITAINQQPTTFDAELRYSEDAFKTVRYIYEGVGSNKGWTLSGVTMETRALILRRHPTWEGATLNFPPGLIAKIGNLS
jgi:hypothetical protein